MSNQVSPAAISFAVREAQASVDEASSFCPKFDSDGLIPAVAMDEESREPLMLAWMNAEALRRTLELGEAVYYSRSRQELWHKGATSGHTQKVLEIRTDCDQDALILYVRQQGAGADGHEAVRRRRHDRSLLDRLVEAFGFGMAQLTDPAPRRDRLVREFVSGLGQFTGLALTDATELVLQKVHGPL
mgnify:CR=1 FL=1